MKRVAALLLGLILITGTIPAGADPDGVWVDYYDFDLRFHLNADAFPLHDREYMQGYADLLETLEFRGNLSGWKDFKYINLNVEVIPNNNPDAAISFRIFGWPRMWLNVSSPLMGEAAVCFQPRRIMAFTVRAYQTFNIPLFSLALLFPTLTAEPVESLIGAWEEGVVNGNSTDSLVTRESIEWIINEWQEELEVNELLIDWIRAATFPLVERKAMEKELRSLPELLRTVTNGGGELTIETDEGSRRYVNDSGDVLYEERQDGSVFESALTLPESPTDYLPGFSFRKEETETESAFEIDLKWDRITEDETLPESMMRVSAEVQHLPKALPADSEFSASVRTEGILIPNVNLLLNGTTTADGQVNLSLTEADRPETGPVFSVTGTVTASPYQGEMWYYIGDIITDYDLFALKDQTLNELRGEVIPGLIEYLPDFLYEIPASSCRSIIDLLERYGMLNLISIN